MQFVLKHSRLLLAVSLAVAAAAPRIAIAQTADAKNIPPLEALRLRAEAGDAQAQMTMGYRYDTGTGVPKDPAEALKWYRLAAEQGDVTSQSNLGLAYHYGRGVPVDHNEAMKWYLKAAEQNFPQAQFNLGMLFSRLAGLQNQDEAMKWFVRAAELNYEPAKGKIAEIEASILARVATPGSPSPVISITPAESIPAPGPKTDPVISLAPVRVPTLAPPPVTLPQTTPRIETPAVQPPPLAQTPPPAVAPKPSPAPAPKPAPAPLVIARAETPDPSLRTNPRTSEPSGREPAEPIKWFQQGAIAARPPAEPRATSPDISPTPRDRTRDTDAPTPRTFYPSKSSLQPIRYDGDENDRRSFEAYLNSQQEIERDEEGRPLRMKIFLPQAILEGIHAGATARSIKVHDLVVKWKKDRPTGNFEDIIEYSARLTIFWRTPNNPDGFTKLAITYDAEIERYTRGELLVTNGPLKKAPVFQVGQGSAVPILVTE
jgi:hypothetical protein